VHEAKGEVMRDPGLAVHILHDGAMESKGLIPGALGTTTKVLASVFGRPDGFTKSGVEFLDVGDELGGFGAVPVDGDKIESAPPACGEEVPHPGYARRGRGNSR